MKRPKVSRQEHKGSTTVMQEIADHSETENLLVSLKQLTFKLFREVQSLSHIPSLNALNGLDFYHEVTRFEIDLINRALLFTGGPQARAARLLNLNVTTLNSMIKHYNINLEVFTCDQQ